MSRFGDRIIEFRERNGISQRNAESVFGISAAALGKIERGETVRPNTWEHIANVIGLSPQEANSLIDMDASEADKKSKLSSVKDRHNSAEKVTPRWKNRRTQSGKVPILGYAAAGQPDRLIMLNDVVGEADCPTALAGVEGAYALYVYGTSMIPRYFPGELVFVHPFKPLTADCFCVVQVGPEPGAPEGGFIKQFKSWDEERLVVSQFNPFDEISFGNSDVIDVHRIVGSSDD